MAGTSTARTRSLLLHRDGGGICLLLLEMIFKLFSLFRIQHAFNVLHGFLGDRGNFFGLIRIKLERLHCRTEFAACLQGLD